MAKTKPRVLKTLCYKKELDTAQGRTLGISTFGSPTSLKASILQNSVDAFKHRLELSNGEQTYHRNA
ncbi:MAG: hypothetical protein P1P67_00365 [Treponema phagedenis]|nr:hypothetical protein [Treponema phagedenis]NVP25026.1 hypothetical protein [Treponema phagedenis]QKS91410.1 hypothetical protein HPJ96_01640 [Treponema phagedenis]